MKGNRFGRLFVLGRAGSQGRKATWLCLCDCGVLAIVRYDHLKEGRTVSCGCYGREKRLKHGHRSNGQSRTYNSWRAMRDRCSRPSAKNYANYGGRGICVCEDWLNSFDGFLKDMGERPPGMTLDRIDVHGNYEPGNCRWATPEEQEANKRWRHQGVPTREANWSTPQF